MALTEQQQNEINAIVDKQIADIKAQGLVVSGGNIFKIFEGNTLRYIIFRGAIQEMILHGVVQKFLNAVIVDRTITIPNPVQGIGWAINNGPIQWVNHIAVVTGQPYIVSIQ